MWFIGLEQIVSNRHILSAIISGSRVLTPAKSLRVSLKIPLKDYLSSPCRSEEKREKTITRFQLVQKKHMKHHPNIPTYPKYHSTFHHFLVPLFSSPTHPTTSPAEGRCLVALKNSGLVRTPFPSKSICRKNCFLTGAVDLEKSKAWKCGDMMQTSRTSKRADDAFKFSFGILVPSIHKQNLRY